MIGISMDTGFYHFIVVGADLKEAESLLVKAFAEHTRQQGENAAVENTAKSLHEYFGYCTFDATAGAMNRDGEKIRFS